MSPSELDPFPFPQSIYIIKEVEFGQVYLVNDHIISMPESDRVQNRRTFHEERRVVIVQNDETNYNDYPTLTIAPLSSKTEYKRRFDIELLPENEPVVTKKVIIRLKLLQPILRADLGECLGEISREKQAQMMQALKEIFGMETD